MGDRGNIRIRQPHATDDLYLYTHWTGYRICQTLADGLRKCTEAGRLTDPAYATRIIFDTLTGLDGDVIGFGISVGSPCDNEYEIPYLRWSDDFGQPPLVTYNGNTYEVADFIERALNGLPA